MHIHFEINVPKNKLTKIRCLADQQVRNCNLIFLRKSIHVNKVSTLIASLIASVCTPPQNHRTLTGMMVSIEELGPPFIVAIMSSSGVIMGGLGLAGAGEAMG